MITAAYLAIGLRPGGCGGRIALRNRGHPRKSLNRRYFLGSRRLLNEFRRLGGRAVAAKDRMWEPKKQKLDMESREMLIAHLAESVELDFPLGATVDDVRSTLRHVLNIPPGAVASVNGHDVGGGRLVSPTDAVKFRTEWGHKGVGDHVWTAEEYCQLFNLTERELQAQIQRGLRVMEVANGTMRITETTVDEFIRGANGGLGGSVLADIAASLKRIADHVDPPPPDIVDTDYIARKLGITKVWAAEMALNKVIPPSCVVPGTGNGKPWKFYRSRIDKWIEMR